MPMSTHGVRRKTTNMHVVSAIRILEHFCALQKCALHGQVCTHGRQIERQWINMATSRRRIQNASIGRASDCPTQKVIVGSSTLVTHQMATLPQHTTTRHQPIRILVARLLVANTVAGTNAEVTQHPESPLCIGRSLRVRKIPANQYVEIRFLYARKRADRARCKRITRHRHRRRRRRRAWRHRRHNSPCNSCARIVAVTLEEPIEVKPQRSPPSSPDVRTQHRPPLDIA